MRVLAVTHGPDVRPEVFADVIEDEGHELLEWDIAARGAPTPSAGDAVLVLGGAQNVGEEVAHPWLHEEYAALRRWVEDGTPIFAICLGAQTLAHALGARVGPVGSTLAGFYDSELTAAGADDPVLSVLPRRFEAFNANGYRFDVPLGAVTLATGPTPQAYRVESRAWGVQFHPEVRREQVLRWFEAEQSLTRPLDELAAELDEKLETWQEHGRRLCRAFLTAARA
ncbi:MAG: type 1 glutamine amidotransferase [Gaiellaceae bacterium]